MLAAARICDVLSGRVKSKFVDREQHTQVKKEGHTVARGIHAAKKFDFGDLHLEDGRGLPILSDNEWDWWERGLLPLPFASVWYEYTINGVRQGMLIREIGTTWKVMRLALLNDGMLACDCTFVCIDQVNTNQLAVEGCDEMLQEYVAMQADEFIARVAFVKLSIYLTLMLRSRTTELRQAPVSKVRAALAASRGMHPPSPHTIVTIVPNRFAYETGKGGKGKPKALHWVRSHLRHYKNHTPMSKWEPNVEHNGTTGWWVCVIAAHLSGSNEFGIRDTEYRVKQGGMTNDAVAAAVEGVDVASASGDAARRS